MTDTDRTHDPETEPAVTEAEEKEEAVELAEGWARVTAVWTFATILVAVGILQATGALDLFPFAESGGLRWLVLVLLALGVVALELWGWL